ncbi:MAG: TIGR03915 family putative DNA repair protein [Oscillibacter sp.]|nr:TIGR03915 family putative DNA repair protein [Oscillibacter sp.]
MNEIVYLYDGTFEGFLCCIFERYAHKEVLTAICRDEDFPPSLFPSRFVSTDSAHARRVLRKVRAISAYACELLRLGFLTCMEEREIHLFRLVEKLLEEGAAFLSNDADETLYPVLRAVRHLHREAEAFRGFVRFSELGGVLGSEIAPKNRVLPLLRSHFCSRYQGERFFIYDRTHREALFYAAGKAVIRPLEDFEMAPPDANEAAYRALWKRFYETIAIRERENPKLQRSNLPLRYRKYMTEFQETPTAQIPPADAQAPAAPATRSAPATHPLSAPSAPASSL